MSDKNAAREAYWDRVIATARVLYGQAWTDAHDKPAQRRAMVAVAIDDLRGQGVEEPEDGLVTR